MIVKNFIVIEGLDGSGTTTQLNLLQKKFINSFCTFEPTNSEIGKLIRRALVKEINIEPYSLALLFSSDRFNHLYEKENGIIDRAKTNLVISDRYIYSSLAYQGSICDYEEIRKINDYPEPELIIYIDTPVDNCLSRIDSRGMEKQIFERRDFLNMIRDNYEKAFKDSKSKLIRIDGLLEIEKINEICIKEIKKIGIK